jgi:hypothetical protein
MSGQQGKQVAALVDPEGTALKGRLMPADPLAEKAGILNCNFISIYNSARYYQI